MMPMICIAGFATWRFINFFKYLLKPRYVFFSFRFMLFKRFFELFRPRGLTRCHSATPILQLILYAKPARPFGNLPIVSHQCQNAGTPPPPPMWPLFGSLRHAWQQLLAQGRLVGQEDALTFE